MLYDKPGEFITQLGYAIGDVVKRRDIKGRKKFLVLGVDRDMFTYAIELGGGSGQRVTFIPGMLKKA